ncbi:MAG: CDGSH iron-sulfur domain-containing protein [Saprospiraceae bacterium]|nr:CDGSH iron-sulfur domain-containing protein [Saprospiraceae bacterium]
MIKVEAIKDGPLKVDADCTITHADGREETRPNTTFFCRCGASGNKPFCDGQHKKINFQG